MLIQIDQDNWVNPNSIKTIRVLPAVLSAVTQTTYSPRVVVDLQLSNKDFVTKCIACVDLKAAKSKAAEIAMHSNAIEYKYNRNEPTLPVVSSLK